VEATPEDFRRHFELLSDEALLDTNRNDLVDLAKQSYDEEVLRRGLNESGDDESEEVEATTAAIRPKSHRPNPGKLSDADTFVQIAKFHSRSEFEIASALLRSAEIACRQGNRIGRRIELELPLMVPAPFAQEAMELLRTQISEKDLEALAETTISLEEETPPEALTDRDA
jgi:hypothetical protein